MARVIVDPNKTLKEWHAVLRAPEPQRMLRKSILASWKRCRMLGLSQNAAAVLLHRVSEEDLQQRLDRNQDLLEVARPHLEWISATLTRQEHIVYIVDGDGIVLHSLGNMPEAMELFGLKPGFDWSEQRMGTNGAGTALIANQPTAVVGPEHFNSRFEDCTCTAAPVHGPDGKVIGAVDVSSPVDHCRPERLITVAHVANIIDEQLRQRTHRVRFSPGSSVRLTPRQTAVLRMIAEGRSCKEIADSLKISPKTVEFHKTRMVEKLGIRTTAELTRYAIRNAVVQI